MTGYPRAFGPYELVGEIARGAIGRVLRAKPKEGGGEVALKMLREEEPGPAAAARFRREAEMAARLRHPNIVPILDAGEAEGRFYYTMPLLEAKPLSEAVRSHPVAPLVEKIARAVHHAHERGVIHRDLKPTNILVLDDGEPMIGDFGIARDQRRATQLTTAGELLGTPAYMAPEQITGMAHRADPRTDVYGLGAVLYFCLTGRPPFDAPSFLELSAQVLQAEPTPPRFLEAGVDPRLERICLRCLRKDPGDRYPSAKELAEDLRQADRTEPARRRGLVPLAALIAAAAGAGTLMIGGADEAPVPPPPGMVLAGDAWVDRCEVTTGDYSKFVAATSHRPPPTWRNGVPPRGKERRPVTHVTRDDAAAYAAWAGKRLPTTEELRIAAAGLERLTPEEIVCAPAALDSGPESADGGRDLSSLGAFNLAGNVAEWTSTPSAAGPRMGVVFGGHWRAPWWECVRRPVEEIPAETRESTIGFRCAKSR
jgi:predicted Ser/Thr protein kinase